MIHIGDSVSHIDMPPFDGVVIGIQEIVNGEPMVQVQSIDGRILSDYLSGWSIEVTESSEEVLYINGMPVIDVEFEEVIDEVLNSDSEGLG